MWVFFYSVGVWQVGFFSPDGEWHGESEHKVKNAAAARCRWLNGGG